MLWATWDEGARNQTQILWKKTVHAFNYWTINPAPQLRFLLLLFSYLYILDFTPDSYEINKDYFPFCMLSL